MHDDAAARADLPPIQIERASRLRYPSSVDKREPPDTHSTECELVLCPGKLKFGGGGGGYEGEYLYLE